jgi:glycosyltransferase involved in cell wall biosynthesis
MGNSLDSLTKILHRQIWQRLPHRLRRKALFRASMLAARRPCPAAHPHEPLIVVGPLRSATGIGQAARLCYQVLKRAGLDVRGIDLTKILMQPLDHTTFEWVDGSSCQGAGTLIMHVNAPLLPLAMAALGAVVRDKFVIGSWAWELPRVPDEWRYGIPFVHEIWVPSSFVADAILPIAMNRPIRVMFHPAALCQPESATSSPSKQTVFRVLTIFNVGSSLARKNPIAAVRAFRAAFGDDPSARLTVKVSNASLFKNISRVMAEAIDGCSNITILDGTVDEAELERLYLDADVFMSLHRAEGFGLTIAEAMLYGIPVIATNWSGNVDFLNDQTGVPIPFRLVSAEDPQGTYDYPGMMWAEADVDVAARELRRLRGDPLLRKQIGEQGARHAREILSPQVYASNAQRYLGLTL